MPHLTPRETKQLLIGIIVAMTAELARGGRAKPPAVAHAAIDYALAALEEIQLKARRHEHRT